MVYTSSSSKASGSSAVTDWQAEKTQGRCHGEFHTRRFIVRGRHRSQFRGPFPLVYDAAASHSFPSVYEQPRGGRQVISWDTRREGEWQLIPLPYNMYA